MNYIILKILHGKKSKKLTVLKTDTGDLAKYAKVTEKMIFKELGKIT